MYVKRSKLDKRSFPEKRIDPKADKCTSSSASPGKYVRYLTVIPQKKYSTKLFL